MDSQPHGVELRHGVAFVVAALLLMFVKCLLSRKKVHVNAD